MPGWRRSCVCCCLCALQERTYKKFYGLLGQRFCYLKREYMVREGGTVANRGHCTRLLPAAVIDFPRSSVPDAAVIDSDHAS